MNCYKKKDRQQTISFQNMCAACPLLRRYAGLPSGSGEGAESVVELSGRSHHQRCVQGSETWKRPIPIFTRRSHPPTHSNWQKITSIHEEMPLKDGILLFISIYRASWEYEEVKTKKPYKIRGLCVEGYNM